MDLGVDLFRTRGRAAKPVAGAVRRELEAADILLLQEEKGSVAPPLKRLSERHHNLARYLASGCTDSEAAIRCNYSPSRISILKQDPAFKELLVFYREAITDEYLGLHERLSGVALDATAHLQERLEENPEAISVGQLIEITKLGADRTGHGPQTSSTNLNVHVDLAGRLEAARKRVSQSKESADAPSQRLIEGGDPPQHRSVDPRGAAKETGGSNRT